MSVALLTAEDIQGIVNQATRAAVKEALESFSNNSITTEVIDRKELQRRLNVSRSTIINMEAKGVIPVIRVNTVLRYNWAAVVEALEAHNGKRPNNLLIQKGANGK